MSFHDLRNEMSHMIGMHFSVSTYLQKSLFVNGDGEGECDTLNLNYDNKYIIT